MRFESYLTLAGLGVVLTGSCVGQDDVVVQLCDAIRSCTDEPEESSCRDALNQSVNSYQISDAALSRCADCLSNLRGDGGCTAMLVGRVCDKACNEVPIALNASTRGKDRESACQLLASCSPETDPRSCVSALEAGLGMNTVGLHNDSTLSMDPTLAKCMSCLFAVQQPILADAGAGGAAGAPSRIDPGEGGTAGQIDPCGAQVVGPGSLSCQALISGCTTACATQPQINGILSRALVAPLCTKGNAQ